MWAQLRASVKFTFRADAERQKIVYSGEVQLRRDLRSKLISCLENQRRFANIYLFS